MPTLLTCTSCGKKLKLREDSTATKVRCPGCKDILTVSPSGITSKRPAPPPDDDDEKPRPRTKSPNIRKETLSDTKPRSRADTEELPDDAREEEVRPRKKQRRRRSETKKSASTVPWWVWAGLTGTLLLFGIVICAALIHAGYGTTLLIFGIGMAILLPVSVVILVISMFIASAALGGVDFGQAHVAIPKAAGLLFVVNTLSMIPFAGPLLALPVWWLGLMGLFSLDFTETRTLVAINWGLNSLFKYFVLAAIVSGILHSRGGFDGRPRAIKVPSGEAAAVKKIEALGGSCDSDEEDEGEGGHVIAVTLDNKPIDGVALALLHSFPKLQVLSVEQTGITDEGLREIATLSTLAHLDLTNNLGVTDAGLAHLAALPKLETINLAGTRVTEAGIQRLRAARPGLEVMR